MSTINRTRYFKDLLIFFQRGIVAVLLALSFVAVPFNAKAEIASGSAYGADIFVSLPLLGNIDVGPLPPGATGSGSDSFGPIHDQTASIAVAIGPVLGTRATANTGLLTGDVSYVNPLPPVNSVTSATGAVTNVNVGANVLAIPTVNVTADAISSTSQITGGCGALTPTGISTLVNAAATVGLNPLLVLPVNPAPNTVLLNLLGISLVLNEQTVGGNGATSSSISTNALHLEVSTLAALGINVDIILGHSQAAVTCDTANLSITKTDSPDPVIVGQPLTYTVTATNNGPGPANEVTIQDALPAGVTVNSITPNVGGSCTPIGVNPIVCTWFTVPSGESRQIVVTVTPNVTGVITNTAVAGTDDFDDDLSNNTATTTTTVNPAGPGTANLSVTKSCPNTATAGLPLSYTLTVANAIGGNTATNVTLTDILPAGLTVTNITAGPFTCNQILNEITCTLASLAAGSSAQVVIATVPSAAGVLTNTVSVGSDQADPISANNTAICPTTVNAAVFKIPTLGEWGLGLLLGALLFLGWWIHPKRRR